MNLAAAESAWQQQAKPGKRVFFLLFLLSGFCSLVYETIWTRLAMAAFGVTTASVSIVVAVFMGGLAAGSWAAGRLAQNGRWSAARSLRAYGAMEFLIGLSGLLVPIQLASAKTVIELLARGATLGSAKHYAACAVTASVVLLPWTASMGATIPLGMAALRERLSFSFLYVANVLGAILGTLVSAFILIELLGFRTSLYLTAAFNFMIAITALIASRRASTVSSEALEVETPTVTSFEDLSRAGVLWLLFYTGFATMAAEVVWFRQFRQFVGTFVYSFSAILACYLAATFAGSTLYRLRGIRPRLGVLVAAVGPLVVVALAAADPTLPINRYLRVPLGVLPCSALLGYLTPMLIDRWSGGRPEAAGLAYAMNAVGCIVGPLAASFLLLPALGPRGALIVLAVPTVATAAWCLIRAAGLRQIIGSLAAVAIGCGLIFLTTDLEQLYPASQVRRDHTATVIATGEGLNKRLLVNGVGMTILTPITKMMAHIPLAALRHSPRRGLVICFGMGTTFRSMLSWDVDTTAVELVPSVPAVFWFYHPDAPLLLASPRSHVVIDDGRRFLERTDEQFDVIVVDPPPPVEAAASSLLYSKEFYSAARRRLAPGGIVQQWLPSADTVTHASVARALKESFRFVRVFPSITGWGLHFLASDDALDGLVVDQMISRLPDSAAVDLLEWGPRATAREQLEAVLGSEIPIQVLLDQSTVPALTDDRPFNEYFWVRRHLQ